MGRMTAKRKMPSKAQTELLRMIDDAPDEKAWMSTIGDWCVRRRPFGVTKLINSTVNVAQREQWVTPGIPEIKLTDLGREILKGMEKR